MIYGLDIAIFFLCFATAIDLSYRRSKGSAYRQLKNKKNKTRIEEICLRDCERFFKIQHWHKLSAVVFILYLAARL